jgi:hypothetical protein
MQFAARLRDRIQAGEISCSIRVWHASRVRVGNSYAMGEGRVVIDSIDRIARALPTRPTCSGSRGMARATTSTS